MWERKFDIRVWVALTQDAEVFFFPEGYLRTSSSPFSIDLNNVDDAFVHLTNNAVQKNASNYGRFEDGNQLSFGRFQEYIDEFHPERNISVREHLVPHMKEIVRKTFSAVRRTIDPFKRKHCFELFGYDFILDEDFNMFLIEVNTNPAIEESSGVLRTLIPRMLEDLLKITVDVLFPKAALRRTRKAIVRDTSTGTPSKQLSGRKQETANLTRSSLGRLATKLDIIGEEG